MPVSPTFTCAACHQTFPQTLESLQAAEAEAAQIWGVPQASQHAAMVVLCDDCYHRRTPADIAAMGQEYQAIVDGLAGILLEQASIPVPSGWWERDTLPPGPCPPGSTFDLTCEKDTTTDDEAKS
jgi:hypothetical protein